MCGRYTLTADGKRIRKLVERTIPVSRRARLTGEDVDRVMQRPSRRKYNIVPTSREPVLLERGGQVAMETAHWWLLPPWAAARVAWRRNAAGEKTFSWNAARKSHFNSRWDTLSAPSNTYWHALLGAGRCLIPADGFIEWPDDALRPKDREKIPRYFTMREGEPFFFAGVYEEVRDDEDEPFLSYNIITVEPNRMLRELPHHRMPAILPPDAAAAWLSPSLRAREAAELLRPLDDAFMASRPIARLVNSAANESPDVLAPLADPAA